MDNNSNTFNSNNKGNKEKIGAGKETCNRCYWYSIEYKYCMRVICDYTPKNSYKDRYLGGI